MSRSLALLSDAAHVFLDLSALTIGYVTAWMNTRRSSAETKKIKRLESRAAFLNAILLILLAGFISYEALERLQSPPEIQINTMLIVAILGFLGNVWVAFRLEEFAHHSINVKAAFFHVLGDLLASLGVILAAIIILLTGWNDADLWISFGIALIITVGALNIMREVFKF